MTSRRRTGILLLVLGIVLVSIGLLVVPRLRGTAGGSPAFHGTAYQPPAVAPAFTLTGHTGRQVSLADLRGGPVLLFFGFTHCPDVCPLTLARLSRITASMGEDADDVRILLITVDPARDTPVVLADYIAQFGHRVVGLTGDAQALRRIRDEYGVYAEPRSGGDAGHPEMAHTTAVFGIDRQGMIRVLLHADVPEDQLRDDIRTLLRM